MNLKNDLIVEAWERLEKSIIYYRDRPIGTIAANDPGSDALNYDQCFIRDFVPSALAFLIKGRSEIVRNFLIETLALQSHEPQMDSFKPGPGLMPASFKVELENGKEYLTADFGEHAIARVPPVDSCLWWIILLRAYVKATGDISLAQQIEFQQGIKLILEMCLAHRFAMYPTMLVPDGAFTIDRRMGVYEHPLEIQVLFYAALRAARELLVLNDDNCSCISSVKQRLAPLTYHLREYYWIDLERLNEIYRFRGDEFGREVANRFNIYSESIPGWLTEWLPRKGGYLAGNLGPGRMDFRFFALGNLMAVITALASERESQQIMNLIEQRWDDLVGEMPMKMCFPALEGLEWKIVTGADLKNRPWSYHNGGNWPFLLWLLVGAAIKTDRVDIAYHAIDIVENYLSEDEWPEYYDGKTGRLIGKQARKYQTWTIAAFLVAKELVSTPSHLELLSFERE